MVVGIVRAFLKKVWDSILRKLMGFMKIHPLRSHWNCPEYRDPTGRAGKSDTEDDRIAERNIDERGTDYTISSGKYRLHGQQ